MIREIYTAALGMLPQQLKLEVTATNLSNANTVGFKKEKIFEREIIEARQNIIHHKGLAEFADLPIGTYTDFEVGNFEETKNPLDVAIDVPNAFFLLEDENGMQYLTRAGSFTLTREGNIVAKDGKFLLGEGGRLNILRELIIENSLLVNAISPEIRISERGEVYLNESYIGRIQLIQVENPETLQRISGVYFQLSSETRHQFLPYEQTTLRQGWLENSNVDPIREMINIIELQRLFEMGAKIIQINDSTLEQSFRLGRFV
ncbi:MAG: flagellar hook-basal body protein [Ignavibacteria bacterium]|nr:flagellar hook-basal body protein [Ignavibacteria bacterium]